MEKLDRKSVDIVQENINQLKALFPEVFIEGKIQFEKLKSLLGNYITTEDDYHFTWHGKNAAIKHAQTPTNSTLHPCKSESVEFDTSQNLFIEGDNLEALKILQKSYQSKVKMIYIDPPYNTGNDFVYKDNFSDNIKKYLELTGQLNHNGDRISTNNNDNNGRYHTNWLNMIYPRLKLARNLLRDDGVILISINDHEQDNLKKVCNEIFLEENFITQFIWNNSTGGGLRKKHVNNCHEYILCFAKNSAMLGKLFAPMTEATIRQYSKKDANGQYREQQFAWQNSSTNPNQIYPILTPEHYNIIPKPGYIYRFIRPSFEKLQKQGRITFKKTKKSVYLKEDGSETQWSISVKDYLGDAKTAPVSLLPKEYVKMNIEAVNEIQSLFGKKVFEYTKPSSLIKYLINIFCQKDSIILDFFAGSATTAAAVLKTNIEQQKHHRFICIQLPEPLNKKTQAYKAGYKTIAEIAKERIRRAAKKIKQENPNYQGDLGFKVFKLDSSNVKHFNADFKTLEQDIISVVEYIKQDKSNEDVLYELLLKYGLDLTLPIEIRIIADKTIYSIGLGALIVCLEKNIDMDIVHAIGRLKEELQPEIMRVVFMDDSFKDDVVKTNAVQILKHYGILDIKSL